MTKYTTNSRTVMEATGLIFKMKRLARAIKDAGVFSASVRGCVFGSLIAGQIVLPVAAVALPSNGVVNGGDSEAEIDVDIGNGTITIDQHSDRVAMFETLFKIGRASCRERV